MQRAVDLALTRPDTFGADATIRDVRRYFDSSDKVDLALVVDASGRVLTTFDRRDVMDGQPDEALARESGTLVDRTVLPDTPEADVDALLDRYAARRLVVVDGSGGLVGLLCRKRSRTGYCTDAGVAARRADRA